MALTDKTVISMENGIKFAGFIIALTIQYSLIKSDIRDLATEKKFQVEHLQYQITELKDCCNNKKNKQISFNNREAILPSGLNDND